MCIVAFKMYNCIYIILLFLSFANLSCCCECREGSILENFCTSSVVARVKFVNVTIDEMDSSNYYKYNVEYVKIYKKPKLFESRENKNVIFSSSPYGMCGYSVDVHSKDNDVVIFGQGSDRVGISICSANTVWGREIEEKLRQIPKEFKEICKFYENNTDLINRYCRSDFVARVDLKDISEFSRNDTFNETIALNAGRGALIPTKVGYNKIYKSNASFEDVKNRSLIELNVFMKECLQKLNASQQKNVVVMGKTHSGRALVFGCNRIFVWNKEVESKFNILAQLNCTLAIDPTECTFNYLFHNDWCSNL